MARILTLALSGLLWALMMSQLVIREFIPYLEYHERPTYRTVLRERPRYEKIRRGIYHLGGRRRIGHSTTVIFPGAQGSIHIDTRVEISTAELLRLVNFDLDLGEDRVSIRSHVQIDAAYELVRFRMKGRILVPFRLEGRRKGHRIEIESTFGNQTLPYQRGMMMSGMFLSRLGVGRPRVGKKWKFAAIDLNPVTLQPELQTLYAEIDRVEDRAWGRSRMRQYHVSVRRTLSAENLVGEFWLDEEGRVLRELVVLSRTSSLEIRLEERRPVEAEEISRLLNEWRDDHAPQRH